MADNQITSDNTNNATDAKPQGFHIEDLLTKPLPMPEPNKMIQDTLEAVGKGLLPVVHLFEEMAKAIPQVPNPSDKK